MRSVGALLPFSPLALDPVVSAGPDMPPLAQDYKDMLRESEASYPKARAQAAASAGPFLPAVQAVNTDTLGLLNVPAPMSVGPDSKVGGAPDVLLVTPMPAAKPVATALTFTGAAPASALHKPNIIDTSAGLSIAQRVGLVPSSSSAAAAAGHPSATPAQPPVTPIGVYKSNH
jgi:hypothetical protein